MVSVGTAKMIHCRRRCWWWCVHDVRLKITMHRWDVWTCMSAANACWIVLCKCMLDIKCSVLRGWSCAITKSFEFWLRTDEKMGLTLSHMNKRFEGHKVLSEFWHDRGGRRRINNGDSMAYEYTIRGCLGFGLTLHAAQASSRYLLHKSNGSARNY